MSGLQRLPQEEAMLPVAAGEAQELGSSDSEDSSGGSGSEHHAVRWSASMVEAAEKVKKSFSPPAKWMVAVGAILATCAGMVNTISLLAFASVVSHLTGHLTALGLRLEGVRLAAADLTEMELDSLVKSKLVNESHGEHAEALWQSVIIIFSFIFGSFLCGLIIPKNAVRFGGRSFYGAALIMNSVLIFMGALLALYHHTNYARAALACGCGLQNAMCTMHLGAVVRTTHVTGTGTDIGSTLGRAAMILLRARCRRRNMVLIDEMEFSVDIAKFQILSVLMCSFFVGCWLGAFGYTSGGLYMLFVPASITGIMGVTYQFFREHMKQSYKRWQMKRLQAEMDLVDAIGHDPSHQQGPHHHASDQEQEEMETAIDMLHDIQNEILELAEDCSPRRHTSRRTISG